MESGFILSLILSELRLAYVGLYKSHLTSLKKLFSFDFSKNKKHDYIVYQIKIKSDFVR